MGQQGAGFRLDAARETLSVCVRVNMQKKKKKVFISVWTVCCLTDCPVTVSGCICSSQTSINVSDVSPSTKMDLKFGPNLEHQ